MTNEQKYKITQVIADLKNKLEELMAPARPTETCTVEPPKDAQPLRADVQDACGRLRWLLSQAERVVTVDAEDRAAVERACKLLAECDNGFDRVRG